jgi:hypothetical protein
MVSLEAGGAALMILVVVLVMVLVPVKRCMLFSLEVALLKSPS